MNEQTAQSTNRRRNRARLIASCCAALMTLGLAGAAFGIDPSRSDSKVGPGRSTIDSAGRKAQKTRNRQIRPTIEGGMPMKYRFVLNSALGVASNRLAKLESCSGLFSEMGADGHEQMASAAYHMASTDQEESICYQRKADAFTEVRGTRIGLCNKFAKLTKSEAAVKLIHEALHHAGMSERPMDPTALSSREINQLVRASCAL